MVIENIRTAPGKKKLSSKRRRERSLRIKCLLFAVGLTLFAAATLSRRSPVRKESTSFTQSHEDFQDVPSGFYAVAHSVSGVPKENVSHPSFAMATTGRVASTVKSSGIERVPHFNVRGSMESCIGEYTGMARTLSLNSTLMSDYDYEVLCQIVEAEAGTEDLVGRILVANVIMNRIKDDEFPSTVEDVVFQYVHGVPQFSPVEDGRIYEVTISSLTREAVKQVLEGVDYSRGALFFIQKDAADVHSVSWFEQNLKLLLQHGVHEFYTYP